MARGAAGATGAAAQDQQGGVSGGVLGDGGGECGGVGGVGFALGERGNLALLKAELSRAWCRSGADSIPDYKVLLGLLPLHLCVNLSCN
jgi:hypothetical protein